MAIGTVKWFNDTKKYGFIETEDQGDVFVHVSDLQGELSTLREGERVEFNIVEGEKGLKAENVVKAE